MRFSGKVGKFIRSDHEINDHQAIAQDFLNIAKKSLFKYNIKRRYQKKHNFLTLSKLGNVLTVNDFCCKGKWTGSELYHVLKDIPETKYQGNNGLT